MKPGVTIITAAIAAAGLAQSGIAVAEEQERELATMKVSAEHDKPVQQRTELGRLTEATPISGAVVDREEMEHLSVVNSLLELGKRVPGVSMVRNMRIPAGGKNYTENRIDGLRVSQTANTSILDEVDSANLERFEVITGPGSALYGSGALGGTLNVFTRQPTRDFEARISQELGSWGLKRTQGAASGSFADGKVGLLLAGSWMDYDGWRINKAALAQKDSAAEHKEGAAIKVLLRPTDTTSVTLGHDYVSYDYRAPGPIPLNATESAKIVKNPSINGVAIRSVNFDSDWQQSMPGVYARTINDYETTFLRLQQMVGDKGEFSVAMAQRVNDSIAYGTSSSVICDNVTVLCTTYNTSSGTTNTLKPGREVARSARPLYRHDFDFAKTTAYIGVELIDIKTESATYNNSYSARSGQSGIWGQGSMTATGQGSFTRERDSTPFFHFEFNPVEHLRLHVGRRFDKITYSTDDRTTTNKDGERTFKSAIWKTGLTYDLSRDHLIWAAYSETFNAPGVSTLLDTKAKGQSDNTIGAVLDPERSKTHELGFRGNLQEAGLHYDVTLFRTTNRGFIVGRDCTTAERTAYNLGIACTIQENAGQLTAQGLESMFSWAATDWLDFGATYTYSDVHYDKYVTKTANLSNHSYAWTPAHRMNLRVAVKPAPGWKVELEGDYISEYFHDDANTVTYSRPDIYSLRASYRSKGWSFWLHAINLTNAKYMSRFSSSTINGYTVFAATAGQGGSGSYTPLTLRAGVSYSF
jgi:iron complex outermembrane recepter protein